MAVDRVWIWFSCSLLVLRADTESENGDRVAAEPTREKNTIRNIQKKDRIERASTLNRILSNLDSTSLPDRA
jgi:hypothetical protein